MTSIAKRDRRIEKYTDKYRCASTALGIRPPSSGLPPLETLEPIAQFLNYPFLPPKSNASIRGDHIVPRNLLFPPLLRAEISLQSYVIHESPIPSLSPSSCLPCTSFPRLAYYFSQTSVLTGCTSLRSRVSHVDDRCTKNFIRHPRTVPAGDGRRKAIPNIQCRITGSFSKMKTGTKIRQMTE